jgi:hypothetical protein
MFDFEKSKRSYILERREYSLPTPFIRVSRISACAIQLNMWEASTCFFAEFLFQIYA